MERRMIGNYHVRCGAGENLETTSKSYLLPYFAPKATKSWNYTSYHNTYWARGNSDTAFMGLYATAYGNPLDCTCAHHYIKAELGDKNCVHAHAGTQLRNDEIIFYDEAAVLLQYIVEFGD